MPLSPAFNSIALKKGKRERKKRNPPFSLRLTEAERARLSMEAAGAPLGAYIKSKLLERTSERQRRSDRPITDRAALARALGLLGQGELAANLRALADAVATGSLPVTPETESLLVASMLDIAEIRCLLVTALGLKTEAQP